MYPLDRATAHRIIEELCDPQKPIEMLLGTSLRYTAQLWSRGVLLELIDDIGRSNQFAVFYGTHLSFGYHFVVVNKANSKRFAVKLLNLNREMLEPHSRVACDTSLIIPGPGTIS